MNIIFYEYKDKLKLKFTSQYSVAAPIEGGRHLVTIMQFDN